MPQLPHREHKTRGTAALWSILLVGGILLGGFLPYHVWGTGFETRRSQEKLEREFAELQASFETGHLWTRSPAGRSIVWANIVPGEVDSTWRDQIEEGDVVGKLEIPAIGLEVVTVESVDVEALRKGPGRFENLSWPGEVGNTAFAGHRTTYSGPFGRIDELEPGAEIKVTTPDGEFVYLVTETVIVTPNDGDELLSKDPSKATLSLVTCHPKYSTRERLIVHAELVGDPVNAPDEGEKSSAEELDLQVFLGDSGAELPEESIVETTDSSSTIDESSEVDSAEESEMAVEENAEVADVGAVLLKPSSGGQSGPNQVWEKGSGTTLIDPLSSYNISSGSFGWAALWSVGLGLCGGLVLAVQKLRREKWLTALSAALIGAPAMVCVWMLYGAVHGMLPAGI